MVDDVSHELNTPLSVIQLEARGLRDGLQTPERGSDQIIREVDRLRGLVTDLNSLAETDYGESRLELEAGSVSELLRAEIERWRPQAQTRDRPKLAQEFAAEDLPEIAPRPDAYEPRSGQCPRQCHSVHRGRRQRRREGRALQDGEAVASLDQR